MADPTLLDLVGNGTMDAEIAATLATIAEEKRSYMVVAIPRLAGKSTVSRGMLDFVPSGVPLHFLSGDEAEIEALRRRPDGGYLVVAEFSPGWIPSYIWGAPVRKVFQALRAGFSLCTCLHASDVEQAYDAICHGNGVADEDASRVNYMVYIERMGSYDFWRRIAAVYEVERVVDGIPKARLLHRWLAKDDKFEEVDRPRLLATGERAMQERARHIQRLVGAGKTSRADIKALMAK